MRTKCLLILALLCSAPALAQIQRAAYGIYGHYALNSHSADFQSLPTLPCCSPIFNSGKGSGIDAGLLYQMPLSPSWLLSARLGFLQYNGVLSTDETRTFNTNGTAVSGFIRHELDAKLATLYAEILPGYRITNRLTVLGGVLIGPSLQHTFNQTEVLMQPTDGSLTVSPNVGSGDIPEAASLHLALSVGVSYDIPLGHGSMWFLSPELFYSIGTLNVVNSQSWKVNSLRLGLALKYQPSDLQLPTAPEGQKSRLVAAVKAYGMDSEDAAEEPVVTLRVEEFLARTHKPLLPYVFFGSGSAEMPLQYHQISSDAIAAFAPDRFSDSSLLAVYYDMLNIVGQRMRERPSSKLILTGCNSNESSEKSNIALSQHRADAVKNYLVNVWGIKASRVETRARNLPANPSNINKEEGSAENRRVELSTNDPELLAPLVTRDTLRMSSPPIVRFHTTAESEAGIASYSLAASQDNKLIQAFNGNGNAPEELDWHLNDNPTTMPRTESPLQYTLLVTDRNAQSFSTEPQQIPVEQLTIRKKREERKGDKVIDRYTLMSFGFNQAEVEPDNQRYLESIHKELTPQSTVDVVGSTDTMGDAAYNQNLSEQRAKAVAKVLDVSSSHVRGVGEQSTFDNTLPEGRFYNRTVRLRIESPAQD